MSDAIGDLLPSALAVALSPIPIIAIVLVLGAPNARRAGPAFAVGWVAGLLAVSAVVVPVEAGVVAAGVVSARDGDRTVRTSAYLRRIVCEHTFP